MKLIESKAELLTQESGLHGIYKMIELAGRTCYKSEERITPNSAKEFVDKMIKSGHTAMLEHGTVYLYDSYDVSVNDAWQKSLGAKYERNPYSRVVIGDTMDLCGIYITTNLRVLVENDWLDDLRYISEPKEFHKKRLTFKFTTDRGVSHELVRHRVFSFAQESTRYCNYNKDKFGNELTFIIPSWTENIKEGRYDDNYCLDWCWNNSDGGEAIRCNDREMCLMGVLNKAETCYMDAIERGCTPQEARQMLPNALKTEIVMTGFMEDWRHFFHLRYIGSTGKPHPDMLQLTTKAVQVLEEAGLWQDVMVWN